MTLEYKSPAQLEQMIAEARKTAQTSTAALVVNGRQVYVPDEHEQRVREVETQRRQAIDAVTTEVKRRLEAVASELLPTDADPVLALKGDELTRASALAPFVREDVAAGNVAAKLRATLQSGDKAEQAIWLRYLSVPGERGLSRWDGEVQELVTQLAAIVRPADPRQDALREKQSTLNKILIGESLSGFLERRYGGQVIRTGRS